MHCLVTLQALIGHPKKAKIEDTGTSPKKVGVVIVLSSQTLRRHVSDFVGQYCWPLADKNRSSIFRNLLILGPVPQSPIWVDSEGSAVSS